MPDVAATVVEAVKSKISKTPANTRAWNSHIDSVVISISMVHDGSPWPIDEPDIAIVIVFLRMARIEESSSFSRLRAWFNPFRIRVVLSTLSTKFLYQTHNVSNTPVWNTLKRIRDNVRIDVDALIHQIPSDPDTFKNQARQLYLDLESFVVNHFLLELAESYIADNFSMPSGKFTQLSVVEFLQFTRARAWLRRGTVAHNVDYATSVPNIIADIMERIDTNLKNEIVAVVSLWMSNCCAEQLRESITSIEGFLMLALGTDTAHQYSTEHFWSEMVITPNREVLESRRRSLHRLFMNLIHKELIPLALLSDQHTHIYWSVLVSALSVYINREIQFTHIFIQEIILDDAQSGLHTVNSPLLHTFLQSFKPFREDRCLHVLFPLYDVAFVARARQEFAEHVRQLRLDTDIPRVFVSVSDDIRTQGKEVKDLLHRTYQLPSILSRHRVRSCETI